MYLFGTDDYIKSVVKKYSPMLLRIAFVRLKSTADAEDAVQDAFLKLITKKPRFKDEDHEKAWLIRTTVNLTKDMLKKMSIRNHDALDDEMASAEGENAQLLSIVHSLPGKYSTIIYLYYYEGYSIKEISRILTLPAATVGTRLSRARALLKSTLEREGILYE